MQALMFDQIYYFLQPYAKSEAEKRKETEEDEEIIYILQLPDWEYNCPVHNQTIKTPRLDPTSFYISLMEVLRMFFIIV